MWGFGESYVMDQEQQTRSTRPCSSPVVSSCHQMLSFVTPFHSSYPVLYVTFCIGVAAATPNPKGRLNEWMQKSGHTIPYLTVPCPGGFSASIQLPLQVLCLRVGDVLCLSHRCLGTANSWTHPSPCAPSRHTCTPNSHALFCQCGLDALTCDPITSGMRFTQCAHSAKSCMLGTAVSFALDLLLSPQCLSWI